MDFSTRAVRALLVGVAVASTVIVVQHVSQAQPFDAAQGGTQPYTKWDQYGGASDSMQYSALAQINRSNVKELERAWFYAVPGEPDRLQFNPLIVDNVMYVTGVRGVVVALDATTGKELWMSTLQAPNRGLAYWESKDRSDRRLVLTASNGIRELDARTGRQILTFGTNGFVDMRVGTPRRNGGPNSSPGRIFENLVIVGSNVGEGYGSPPGDIRAYDVLSGKLMWTFHTIPRPGEYGYETWPETAFRYAGGANTWGDITLDEKNGIVFLPTGSPTHDLYGGDRQGDNLFGNCLIALDARTGKRLWHFQIVHHDLWDYDNAAAPKLLTVQHNGKPIDIVAQAGKTGFLYVFERKTGKPLWPIEERPVPKSEVPGEYSSPTQPFPTKPPPFARQSMTPEEVNPFVSPEEQEKLKQLVREAANEGVFTPSSHLRPHIQFPGAWGGANWGSVAGDPQTGMVYVRSLEMISYRKMSLVEPNRGGGAGGGGGRGQGTPLGPREQAGQGVYMQRCSTCHGAGQMPMRSIKVLGSEGFRSVVRRGVNSMPGFPASVISNDALEGLEAYLMSLPTSEEQAGNPSEIRLPQNPNRYQGPPTRYGGSFSAGWYTSNGYPVTGPPWSQLVAYDLNEGTIKWRVADGTAPGVAGKVTTTTGTVRPQNSPVVTAGGLVFLANSQDCFLRAFDKATGELVWERELEGNPEGMPAVYQVNGRQYIAFAVGASWGTGGDPVWRNPLHRKQAKIEAQGYHVYALPEKR
jgi:quinoprotein glucose dehydrogenase